MPQKCPASPVSRQRGLPPHSAIAWAAKTTAMCCSKSWRLRSPKANCLQSQLLVSVLFLTCRHHIVTWWPGTELWSLPVLQEPYSHHAPMTASKPNSLQRPPRYHHIGIRASTYEFLEDTNLQSTAPCDPAILRLAVCPEELKTDIQTDACTQTFILCWGIYNNQKGKQTKCPSAGK